MRLITDSADGELRYNHGSVHRPKVGAGFDRIELNAADVYQLSRMPATELAEWVNYWQLGFLRPAG
jgi:hypothetical protein